MSPVALVTGASSGLGRGLAVRAAREGWDVALMARRHELLRDVGEEVEALGRRAAVLPCDVSDKEGVRRAVERCRGELGPPELVVANAGVGAMTRPESLSADEVERVLRVNFLGAVYLVEAVLPEMLARDRGHLVAVASLAGVGGLPLTAAYSASKGAMINFFESLRIDLRSTGVDVTLVTPGYVRTPLTDHNRHGMPFLMELDDAVERIWRGIEARKLHLAFPVPLATLAWVMQIAPRRLYDWVASRVDRRKEEPGDEGARPGAAPTSPGPPDPPS